MQPTEMPVSRLTADCIWNTFRNSGKRHLLLTGSSGSGKTTLLSRLTPPLPGITTYAVPGRAVYLRENETNREGRIGLYDPHAKAPRNRMKPWFMGFAALGIPALRRCRESDAPWISIDEIGYVELSCPEYCTELLQLLEAKQVIACVRKQELPFLQKLLEREDVFVIDLDAPLGNPGCVIMASGLGTRFGGNKLMAPFRGQPMIAAALDATEGIFAKRVVVTRHGDVAAFCQERGAEVVLHDLPYRSDTVRLGLEALGDVSAALFCPGDQPLLTRNTVMSLLLGQNDTIRRPICGDTPGAPILFPSWAFPELLTLPQGKGGGFVAKAHPDQVTYLPIANPNELKDADTPEALAELEGTR